ncbi:MAG: hypothetical protein KKA64_02765 [Nanoarchaeota archaeon]|nr:hypothetical protein [Nanoarchaeota archaeon]
MEEPRVELKKKECKKVEELKVVEKVEEAKVVEPKKEITKVNSPQPEHSVNNFARKK